MAFGAFRFPSFSSAVRAARRMTVGRVLEDAGASGLEASLVLKAVTTEHFRGLRLAAFGTKNQIPTDLQAEAAGNLLRWIRANPAAAAPHLARRQEQRDEAEQSREARSGLVTGLVTTTIAGVAGLIGQQVAERREEAERVGEALRSGTLSELVGGEFGALQFGAPSGPTSPPGGAAPVLGVASGMRGSGSGGTMAPVAPPTSAPRVDPSFWTRLRAALANRGSTTRQPTPLQAWTPASTYSTRQPTPLRAWTPASASGFGQPVMVAGGRSIYSGYNPTVWR